MSLSAAKSRVLQARTQMETNRIDDVEPTLDAAEGFLKNLSEAEKAPLLTEIQAIRGELSTMLRPDDQRKLSGAQGKIRQAEWQLEMKMAAADIELALVGAEEFLASVADRHKAAQVTQIAALRAKLNGTTQPAVTAPPVTPPPVTAPPVTAPTAPPVAATSPAPVLVAPAAPLPAVAAAASGASASAEVESAASAADSAVRQAERDIMMNERSFDVARYATLHTAAEAKLAALVQARLDHPAAATLRLRLDEAGEKAEGFGIDTFKQSIDGFQRSAGREVTNFDGARQKYGPRDADPAGTADKLTEWASKVRAAADAARDRLTSERGQAVIAEVAGWVAGIEHKVAELRLLADAFALFRAQVDVQDFGGVAFTSALDSAERNFGRDPERVVQVWDAAKKLVGAFRNPRFAEVDEI